MRNAVTSSGVFIVIVHLFFLMGQGLTLENIQHIENDPSFVSKSGTILRLWDDLGSAEVLLLINSLFFPVRSFCFI